MRSSLKNMREIKFRVWDKKYLKWFNPEEDSSDGAGLTLGGEIAFAGQSQFGQINPKDENRFVIQQFTGLLDKNGVEIYEGDILQDSLFGDEPPGLYVVEFRVSEWSSGFAFTSKKNKWNFGGPVDKYLTVIGNIFENPELI